MIRPTLQVFAGLASGAIFGAGLAMSGMVDPLKVLAFLDVFGEWDPGLAVTMAGALLVAAIGFRLLTHKPLLDEQFFLPDSKGIDKRLIAGAVLFGIGWGAAGYCPGPAIAGLAMNWQEPALFVLAMIGGNRLSAVLHG